jgi:hypothetical protein
MLSEGVKYKWKYLKSLVNLCVLKKIDGFKSKPVNIPPLHIFKNATTNHME